MSEYERAAWAAFDAAIIADAQDELAMDEIYRAYAQLIMQGGEYTITANADGTYSHKVTWKEKRW